MKTAQEISVALAELINNYVPSKKSDDKIVSLRESISAILMIIEQRIEYADRAIEDAKNANMVLSQLEVEGYKRACLSIQHEITSWDDNVAEIYKERSK